MELGTGACILTLKEYLLQESVLKLPNLMKPFFLRTDASEVEVAAILLPENKGMLYLVGYTSRKSSLAEASDKNRVSDNSVGYDALNFIQLARDSHSRLTIKIPEGYCLQE